MSLQQFMEHNVALDIVHRVHIMRSLVQGMAAVHRAGMVQLAVQPANIFCFAYPEEGVLRWKYVDWDCCLHEGSPLPSADAQVTPAYTPPEMMRHVHVRSPPSPPSALPSSPTPSPSLKASWKMDMWSLGLTFLFVLRSQEIWHLVNPPASEAEILSRLLSLKQTDIDHLLDAIFRGRDKERSLLKECLQINPSRRAAAETLLNRSLFSTGMATTHAANLGAIREGVEELQKGQQDLHKGQQDLQKGVNEALSKLDQVLQSLSEGFRDVRRGVTQTLQGLTTLCLSQEESHFILQRVNATLGEVSRACQGQGAPLTVSEATELLQRMKTAVTEAVQGAVDEAVSSGLREAGDALLVAIRTDLSHMGQKIDKVALSLDDARSESNGSAEALQGCLSRLAEEMDQVRDSTQRLLAISEGLQQSHCDLSLSMQQLRVHVSLSSEAVRRECVSAVVAMEGGVSNSLVAIQNAILTGLGDNNQSELAGVVRDLQSSLADGMRLCQHEVTRDLKESLSRLSGTIQTSCSCPEALSPLLSLLRDMQADLVSLSQSVQGVSVGVEEVSRRVRPIVGMVKTLLLGGYSVPTLPWIMIEQPETTLDKLQSIVYVSPLSLPHFFSLPRPLSLSLTYY